MGKTDGLAAAAKAKSERRVDEVLKTIADMKRRGDPITFSGVQKRSGAARSFLYNNEAIRKVIEDNRLGIPGSKRAEESKDAIIAALRLKVKQQEARIHALERERGDSYKAKYEKLCVENKALKQQLKMAYEY